jgi:hypothetical protein
MTAKDYLSQVYKLSREIESNKRRIAELESEIGGLRAINYSGDKVQSSPVDALAEGIAVCCKLIIPGRGCGQNPGPQ